MVLLGLIARIIAVLVPIIAMIILVGGTRHIDLALVAGLLIFGFAAFAMMGLRPRDDWDARSR